MILSFKQQFIKPIQDGTKIHTFRLDPHDRWKAGRSVQGATGVRTKHYKEFFRGLCYSVQPVKIRWVNFEAGSKKVRYLGIFIDGRKLDSSEFHSLAVNDGFKDIVAFMHWFDKDFSGKIIHWTKFKY